MTTRRDFLRGAGVTAVAGLLPALLRPGQAGAAPADTSGQDKRSQAAFRLRQDAAHAYLDQTEPPEHTNGDEERYDDRRASFSKTLPHNDLGEVKPEAYKHWLAILAAGDPKGFERVPRDPTATVKLNNPQAAYAFDLVGVDPHATRLPPPPAFASARMACEMAEVYWLALTADVPFREYGSHPLIAAALADLNAFSAPLGPSPHRKLAPDTLFRGETRGDLAGPYVSQFLWLDVPYGNTTIEQRYRSPTRGQGFLTDYKEWLACQSGVGTGARLRFDPEPRFICGNRELAEFVHRDFSFQSYLNAALIMLAFGESALSPTNPYRGSRTQFGGITFGGPNVLALLAQASQIALKGSYYHKWLVHRRLRPEVFAGRIETHLSGRKKYDVHADVLGCDAVARVRSAHGTRLLPCAYPEGCPTHPSYPAAHAANAGACATILKAFFNEEFVVPRPVEAKADGAALEPWRGRDLTLGGEINRLACNIMLGRDAAGVHYRSDGAEGLSIGERQAIGVLCDYSRTYNEHFDGFALTRFDGRKVKIANGKVTVA
jgi:hypothetical protein